MKQLLKNLLRRTNYRLIHSPEGIVRGIDWRDDLRALLPASGSICIDAGANEGQTIRKLLAALAEPVIHAFEPSSAAYDRLSSVGWGSGVHLYRAGMGEASGQMSLRNLADSRLSSFLELDQDPKNRFRDVSFVATELVNVTTVDGFRKEQSIEHVDLLKIDTQGFELQVLRGAQQSFAEHRVSLVFVEMNFVPMYAGQGRPAEIDEYLLSHGFRLVDLYEKVRDGHSIAWCTALYACR